MSSVSVLSNPEEFRKTSQYFDCKVWLDGEILNWEKLCEENNLIAESDSDLLAWWLYYEKPLNQLSGIFTFIHQRKCNGIV